MNQISSISSSASAPLIFSIERTCTASAGVLPLQRRKTGAHRGAGADDKELFAKLFKCFVPAHKALPVLRRLLYFTRSHRCGRYTPCFFPLNFNASGHARTDTRLLSECICDSLSNFPSLSRSRALKRTGTRLNARFPV
jgi:hypothetical protein